MMSILLDDFSLVIFQPRAVSWATQLIAALRISGWDTYAGCG
jgi:hypothetical protein